MQKITPCLWFDDQAEEAVNFYLSLFPDARILQVTYYSEAGPGPEGSVLEISFQLFGQHFTALNGGPHFSFSPAISFVINCDSQAEVDYWWEKLTEGGEESQCGWLTDRYGLSWQVVPVDLLRMLQDPDPVKVLRVTEALYKMGKLDLAELQSAYEGN